MSKQKDGRRVVLAILDFSVFKKVTAKQILKNPHIMPNIFSLSVPDELVGKRVRLIAEVLP